MLKIAINLKEKQVLKTGNKFFVCVPTRTLKKNCVRGNKNIKILQSSRLQSINIKQFYWKTRIKFAKSSNR